MEKFKSILLAIIASSVVTAAHSHQGQFHASEESDYIRDLTITVSDKFDGRIYANGNMQAEVLVSYRLVDSEDEVEKINFKRLYSREDIETIGWTVDDEPNGFYHTIGSYEFNQELLKESLALAETGAKKGNDPDSNEHVRRFIRAERLLDTDICIEIVTRFGHSADTCDGNTNNSYVSISSISPVFYGSNSYELRVSEERDHRYAQQARVIQIVALADSFPGVHTQDEKRNTTVRPDGRNSIVAYHSEDSEGYIISNQLIPYDSSLEYTKYIWRWQANDPTGSVSQWDFLPNPGHRLVMNAFSHRGDGRIIGEWVKEMWYSIVHEYLALEPSGYDNDHRAWKFVTDSNSTLIGLNNKWMTDEWKKIEATEGLYEYIDYYGTNQNVFFSINTTNGRIVFNNVEF